MNAPRRMTDYERRRDVWHATSTRWLRRVFPALADSAQRVAHGDRGVVEMTMDTAGMEHMLSPRSTRVPVELIWHPVDNFIVRVGDPAHVGPKTGSRWGNMVAVMDPRHDVAVFLHSTPEADGHWFFRFLVVHDGRMPVH